MSETLMPAVLATASILFLYICARHNRRDGYPRSMRMSLVEEGWIWLAVFRQVPGTGQDVVIPAPTDRDATADALARLSLAIGSEQSVVVSSTRPDQQPVATLLAPAEPLTGKTMAP
ncbi:MAG TPA: hypothetical protein VGH38_33125 [Bryobacteraceae bacterium]